MPLRFNGEDAVNQINNFSLFKKDHTSYTLWAYTSLSYSGSRDDWKTYRWPSSL